MDVKVGIGTVKWFNDRKGFGLIIPDDLNLGKVFVHFSAIKQEKGHRQLYKRQRVIFYAAVNEKGLYTDSVEVIDTDGSPSRPVITILKRRALGLDRTLCNKNTEPN